MAIPGRSDSQNQPPAEMSRNGINLFLNNRAGEAEVLFTQYKDSTVQMRGGYCFVTFMNAMMTFEEDKINLCLQALRETEQRCGRDLGTMYSMRKYVNDDDAAINFEQRLETQIVLGDCHVFMAMLLFTFQDMSGYVKGAWILRKAWKVYDRTYREIKKIYQVCFGLIPANLTGASLLDLPPPSYSVEDQATSDTSEGWLDAADSQDLLPNVRKAGSMSDVTTCPLPADVVSRLMCAISFGYGLFQLCLSLSPSTVLKIGHVFGFEGNRDFALNCLGFSRKGEDMRSPLSAITLLWFHTIIRPLFGLDGQNVAAGTDEATVVLNDSDEFKQSAMFLFYRGRIERLKGLLDSALVIFQNGISVGDQKEVQFICYQEIGWCLLLQLKLNEALQTFITLKQQMRWGKPFHTYLVAICLGCLGETRESHANMAEIPNMARRKNNQLELFVLKRAQYLSKTIATQDTLKIYMMEVLYMWRTLSCAPNTSKIELLKMCGQTTPPARIIPLKCLIEGVLRADIGENNQAKKCFEECIAKGNAMKEDQHVPAFACYELGLLLGQDEATVSLAKQYLHQAKDNYKGYDFENRLSLRIHAALINLERRNS